MQSGGLLDWVARNSGQPHWESLKAAGALGLLLGIGVPAVGIAAAAGPRPVFNRRYHHSLARARLLVRPGDRVPSPGDRRAGDASGFKLKKAI